MQLNASFRELAKVITTRTPDIGYHELCADLPNDSSNNTKIQATISVCCSKATGQTYSFTTSKLQSENFNGL